MKIGPFNTENFAFGAFNIDAINRFFGLGEAPLLPADSRQVRPLTIVVAIMCALGCLAALTARAGFRAADNWTTDLKSAMTILIESPRDEISINRAITIAKSVDGVSSAVPMGKAKAKSLLRNYGANIGALIDDLPMPALIEIGVLAEVDNVEKNLGNALSSAGYKVEIDDHSRYSSEIIRSSAVLRGFAILALLGLLVAAVASIGFAARAALETRREAVEILHLVGAEDAFVAREVQARFMRLGLVSGGIGALGAGVLTLIGVLIMGLGASELTKGTALLKWYDAWVLIAAPIVTAIASALAARIAARETLRELV